jgi:hypothetical protein
MPFFYEGLSRLEDSNYFPIFALKFDQIHLTWGFFKQFGS